MAKKEMSLSKVWYVSCRFLTNFKCKVSSVAGVAELTSDTAAFGLHDARIFESYGDMPSETSRSTLVSLVVETGPGDWTVPDLSMWASLFVVNAKKVTELMKNWSRFDNYRK